MAVSAKSLSHFVIGRCPQIIPAPKATTVWSGHSCPLPLTLILGFVDPSCSLAALPDAQIDTSDIPELPPGAWKDAVRGRFYRPVKQPISMRLDADVVAWLKKRGKGYQTRVNSILRQTMLTDIKRT